MSSFIFLDAKIGRMLQKKEKKFDGDRLNLKIGIENRRIFIDNPAYSRKNGVY